MQKQPRTAAVTAALVHKYYQKDLQGFEEDELLLSEFLNQTTSPPIESSKASKQQLSVSKKAKTTNKKQVNNKCVKREFSTPKEQTTNTTVSKETSTRKEQQQASGEQDNSNNNIYIVDKVVDKKQIGRKTLYQVKWEGYNSDQNTWEPMSNLQNVRHLIKEFNAVRSYYCSKKEDACQQVDLNEESTCIGGNLLNSSDKPDQQKEQQQKNQQELVVEQEVQSNSNKTQEGEVGVCTPCCAGESEEKEKTSNSSSLVIKKKRVLKKRKRSEVVDKKQVPQNQQQHHQQSQLKKRNRKNNTLSVVKPLKSQKQVTTTEEREEDQNADQQGHQEQDQIQEAQSERLPVAGDFMCGDIAQKVLQAKMTSNSQIMVTVSWERRANGELPKPSNFTNQVCREYCPKLLVDFYESRINLKCKNQQPQQLVQEVLE